MMVKTFFAYNICRITCVCVCRIRRFWLCAGRWTLVWSMWTLRVCCSVSVWPDSCRSSLLCCWRGGWSLSQTNSGTDRYPCWDPNIPLWMLTRIKFEPNSLCLWPVSYPDVLTLPWHYCIPSHGSTRLYQCSLSACWTYAALPLLL